MLGYNSVRWYLRGPHGKRFAIWTRKGRGVRLYEVLAHADFRGEQSFFIQISADTNSQREVRVVIASN